MKTLLKLSVQQALCRTPERAVVISLGKEHLIASGALQLHSDLRGGHRLRAVWTETTTKIAIHLLTQLYTPAVFLSKLN